MRAKRYNYTDTKGVTLIELIVVIGIVAVVSLVVSFNYSKFTTNVSIRNLAQDIALSVRKAQSYATSVQAIPGGSTSGYPAYGVAFSLAAPSANVAAPSQKRFILFADVNENGKYDAGSTCGTPQAGSECVEGFAITTSDVITRLCSDAITGTCTSSAGQSMVAVFCRPAPDAAIYANGSGVGHCVSSTSYMEVIVQSVKGLSQTIRLWNTGQISVQ